MMCPVTRLDDFSATKRCVCADEARDGGWGEREREKIKKISLVLKWPPQYEFCFKVAFD